MIKHLSILAFFLTLVMGCQQEAPEDPQRSFDGKWIDLTYSFDENTIYWPTADGFKLDTVFEGQAEGGYYYSAYSFSSAEHGGTHLDAPVHFSKGKLSVDQIDINQLSGDAVVIDVSSAALENRDFQVSAEDILAWEQNNGIIPENSIILIRTGYGQFWGDKNKYMGTSESGPEAVENLHFPGLHPACASWLIKERNFKAIGLDTPSIDYGQSPNFESHQILFSKNIPVFENVANLDKLPATGSWVIGLPIKIKGGSGGPLRIVALVPE